MRLLYVLEAPNTVTNMSYLSLGIWVNVELGISIICTSATTLKPLLVKMRVIGSSTSHGTCDDASQFRQMQNQRTGVEEESCLRAEHGTEDISLHAYTVSDDRKSTAEAISVFEH